MDRLRMRVFAVAFVVLILIYGPVQGQVQKPNILVIFGDDVGHTNISAHSDGPIGYETPNIDRIAREGIGFLHYYGVQSCTAGRAAFLTGHTITKRSRTFHCLSNRYWSFIIAVS